MIENFTDWAEDWADQYLHELQTQSEWRSNMLQGLIAAQDYEACREFIDEWEQDDKHPNSLAQKYNRAAGRLRQLRTNATNTSANSLTDLGAGVCSRPLNRSGSF